MRGTGGTRLRLGSGGRLSLSAEQSANARLLLAALPSPRREVRGGFPVCDSVPVRSEPEELRRGDWPQNGNEEPRFAPQHAHRRSEAPGIIDQLFDRLM